MWKFLISPHVQDVMICSSSKPNYMDIVNLNDAM